MANSIIDRISLGGLVEGFSSYIKTALAIFRHPIKFREDIDVHSKEALNNGINFLIYGVLLFFFLLIPVFRRHGIEISNLTFVIRFLIAYAMYCALLHISLKVIGRSRASFSATAVIFTYIAGFLGPLAIILLYPMILTFGIHAVFGSFTEIDLMRAGLESNAPLRIQSLISTFFLIILSLTLFTSWLSWTHYVGKLKVLFSCIISWIIGGLIELAIINPLTYKLIPMIEEWLRYA